MNFEKQHKFYKTLYSVVFSTEPIVVGGYPGILEPEQQVCRFCGKHAPEVTFNKIAHAIPHMLGNDRFMSRSECDKCNGYFNQLENNLDIFTSVHRTIGHVAGKKGLADFANDTVHIQHKQRGKIHINFTKPDAVSTIQDDLLVIDTGKMSVLPIAVYKALVKIALSLMPFQSTHAFSSTKAWLLDKKHRVDMRHEYSCICYRYTLSYILDHVFANVLIRKDNVILTPYCWLILAFSNQIYQVVIPCFDEDKDLLSQGEIDIPPYLFPFENVVFTESYIKQWGYPLEEKINLGSHEKQAISDLCNNKIIFKSIQH